MPGEMMRINQESLVSIGGDNVLTTNGVKAARNVAVSAQG
jgi:hypothetical protein